MSYIHTQFNRSDTPFTARGVDVGVRQSSKLTPCARTDLTINMRDARLLVPMLSLAAHSYVGASDSGFVGPGFEAYMTRSIR